MGEGEANFVACHQFDFLERLDVLKYAGERCCFPAQLAPTDQMKYGIIYQRSSKRYRREKITILYH